MQWAAMNLIRVLITGHICDSPYLSRLFFCLQFQFLFFLAFLWIFIFPIVGLFVGSAAAAAAIASVCTARQIVGATWRWWYGIGFYVRWCRYIWNTFRLDRRHFGGQTKLLRIRWCHRAQQWHTFVWTRLLCVRGESAASTVSTRRIWQMEMEQKKLKAFIASQLLMGVDWAQ